MRCPHCDKILSDAWVKRAGATLMGMAAAGKSKARPRGVAQAAAKKRGALYKELANAKTQNERLRKQLQKSKA